MNQNCGNCLFWYFEQYEDVSKIAGNKQQVKNGQCRRHPPHPIIMTEVNPVSGGLNSKLGSFFPSTREEINCGDFKPRLQS